jgi:hypothetical protein
MNFPALRYTSLLGIRSLDPVGEPFPQPRNIIFTSSESIHSLVIRDTSVYTNGIWAF